MPDTQEQTEEHPIIFSRWSIRRILADEKTQTRRSLSEEVQERLRALNGETTDPDIQSGNLDPSSLRFFRSETGHSGEGWYACLKEYPSEGAEYIGTCSYGQPGDVLWVREAFRLPAGMDYLSPSEYVAETSEQKGAAAPIC